jgi:hypothetical protein
MSDKYHAMVWIEVEEDKPLTSDQILRRVSRAINTIGDQTVYVACNGPIRKDTKR